MVYMQQLTTFNRTSTSILFFNHTALRAVGGLLSPMVSYIFQLVMERTLDPKVMGLVQELALCRCLRAKKMPEINKKTLMLYNNRDQQYGIHCQGNPVVLF